MPATLDWRGQGLSERLLDDPRKGHVTDFSEYELDLDVFMREVVLPDCPPPHFAIAHSMGGSVMMNIARNASIDTLRSRGYQNSRKNQSIQDNVDTIQAGDVLQPGVDPIGLRKMLEKLRAEQRILIELAYFKGYTHEEIAELEKIPLGTVKTRIRNALIQLRGLLK